MFECGAMVDDAAGFGQGEVTAKDNREGTEARRHTDKVVADGRDNCFITSGHDMIDSKGM